jgi:hypothetical protein
MKSKKGKNKRHQKKTRRTNRRRLRSIRSIRRKSRKNLTMKGGSWLCGKNPCLPTKSAPSVHKAGQVRNIDPLTLPLSVQIHEFALFAHYQLIGDPKFIFYVQPRPFMEIVFDKTYGKMAEYQEWVDKDISNIISISGGFNDDSGGGVKIQFSEILKRYGGKIPELYMNSRVSAKQHSILTGHIGVSNAMTEALTAEEALTARGRRLAHLKKGSQVSKQGSAGEQHHMPAGHIGVRNAMTEALAARDRRVAHLETGSAGEQHHMPAGHIGVSNAMTGALAAHVDRLADLETYPSFITNSGFLLLNKSAYQDEIHSFYDVVRDLFCKIKAFGIATYITELKNDYEDKLGDDTWDNHGSMARKYNHTISDVLNFLENMINATPDDTPDADIVKLAKHYIDIFSYEISAVGGVINCKMDTSMTLLERDMRGTYIIIKLKDPQGRFVYDNTEMIIHRCDFNETAQYHIGIMRNPSLMILKRLNRILSPDKLAIIHKSNEESRFF